MDVRTKHNILTFISHITVNTVLLPHEFQSGLLLLAKLSLFIVRIVQNTARDQNKGFVEVTLPNRQQCD